MDAGEFESSESLAGLSFSQMYLTEESSKVKTLVHLDPDVDGSLEKP